MVVGEMEGGRYRTVTGVVAGFFAIAAFFVGTVADKVARLLAFLASHLVHILGFLDDVSIYTYETKTKSLRRSTTPIIENRRWHWGCEMEDEKYRTLTGTMAFLVAIVAKEFWLFGTVGGEMPSFLAATTGDCGEVLGSHGFRTLARIMTLNSERLADKSPHGDKGTVIMRWGGRGGLIRPAIPTTFLFGTITTHVSFVPIISQMNFVSGGYPQLRQDMGPRSSNDFRSAVQSRIRCPSSPQLIQHTVGAVFLSVINTGTLKTPLRGDGQGEKWDLQEVQYTHYDHDPLCRS